MRNVLKTLKNELKTLDIPYNYGRWNDDVVLPYFVGELDEIETTTEYGKREFTFILTGEDIDTYSNLYSYADILRKTYKHFKTITLDNGIIKIKYNRTFDIPVEDERIKRTQTEFTIYLWETE